MSARGKQERRTLVLWPEEWSALEAMAVEFNTCPPSGPTAGQPVWRSLIKELSRGHLILTRVSEQGVVDKVLHTVICSVCGRQVLYGGPGAQHFQAHVERGEAVDLGVEIEDWEVRYAPAE